MNYKRLFFLGLAIAGLITSIPTGSAHASSCTSSTQILVSDTNVQIKGHGSAVLTYAKSSLWTTIVGSSWIWKSELVENPEISQSYVFEKSFEIDGTVHSAFLDIAGDDYYKVFINGTEIGAEFGEDNFTVAKRFNLPDVFINGTNELTIEATNAKYFYETGATAYTNPAGIIFKLEIQSEQCSGGGNSSSKNKGDASGTSPTSIFEIMSSANTEAATAPSVLLTSPTFEVLAWNASTEDTDVSSDRSSTEIENGPEMSLLASAFGSISPTVASSLRWLLIVLALILSAYIARTLYSKRKLK